MAYPLHLPEEELKNKVAADYFSKYDATRILGRIDFCVSMPSGNSQQEQKELFDDHSSVINLYWAEAKKGSGSDLMKSLAQLIFTVTQDKTLQHNLPPLFFGAFDAEKIAFVSYQKVRDLIDSDEVDWKGAPTNYASEGFKKLLDLLFKKFPKGILTFKYGDSFDEPHLRKIIAQGFQSEGADPEQTKVTKTNFLSVYYHWLDKVKPSIAVKSWKKLEKSAKNGGILDADFFLADLMSQDNETFGKQLLVVLRHSHYNYQVGHFNDLFENLGLDDDSSSVRVEFKDAQKAHADFWRWYKRPPEEEVRKHILSRRDLLVPPDIRERKGSYFTPQMWVQRAHQYLAHTLGEDWQAQYVVWDCCAGTGNLLVGLQEPYRIYASTLDQTDVDVMKDSIHKGRSPHLLESHVFQFDFLEDPLDSTKIPASLRAIINNPVKRKKLVVLMNAPYCEGDCRMGKGRKNVAVSKIRSKYKDFMGPLKKELYVQFLTRIYKELPDCIIAEFSKLKVLQSPRSSQFRENFRAKLEQMFIVPSDSFDNVKGKFPIGFKIWNTSKPESFTLVESDIFDKNGNFAGTKEITSYTGYKFINDWIKTVAIIQDKKHIVATVVGAANDIQNNSTVCLMYPNASPYGRSHFPVSKDNLIEAMIYIAVRLIIKDNWINDRDQYIYPNDSWKSDKEFQLDCLAFGIFINNRIKVSDGVNHWIPYPEEEVFPSDVYESHFLIDYLRGKAKADASPLLLDTQLKWSSIPTQPVVFSSEAQAVMDAGRDLFKYYHKQPNAYPNASLIDIKAFFCGRANGRLKTKSADHVYMELIADLRKKLKALAQKIEPKIYEHGFLLK